MKIVQGMFLEQVGMDSRNAVYGMSADAGQVCHAYEFAACLLYDGHSAYPCLITWKFQADLVKEPTVDLKDYLKVPWKQVGKELHGPLLKGLGEQGMVCVREGLCGNAPCLFPVHAVNVHEQAH